ncbi:uncharacterized protein EI90DRAFT_3133587 [Cantharellus anzutake]|uniref:uncharacterized protein n=1 Tax=Cantharellus anzutake TaxID=1750568 RepID=UPI001906E0A4|nr:uncharacterized protein EI90DRAFT_3133587 [Cantharellus anzutake]KAF8317824.1 hypothetical protein EI90DRAFT_3133587 [Cantharellus anzutake]
MDPSVKQRLLNHCDDPNWVGNVTPDNVSYHSQASANSQSICGSWMSVSDCSTVTNIALFGIITKAELSEYGNQYTVPFNSWKEQGCIKVNLTKFQIHLSLPLSALASLKKRFADQLVALNHLKNASTLGHLVEGVISIHSHRLPISLDYLRSFFTNFRAPVSCNHLCFPRWSPPPLFNILPTPP